MGAHPRYELIYVYDGSEYCEEMFFRQAVEQAAECLRRGCWPVTIRPTRRIDTEVETR